MAGFRLKNRSKFSAIVFVGTICSDIYVRVFLFIRFGVEFRPYVVDTEF